MNVRKIATGQRDDYATGCLLDYLYFKENVKMTAVEISKQQFLDASPRFILQINFTWNLGALGVSLLGNMVAGNRVNRVGKKWIEQGKVEKWFLMPLHPLTNFEIQKNYQTEPGFNGVYSSNKKW